MKTLALIVAGLSALTAIPASGAKVPTNMRGTWGRHGRCDLPAERLIITANTARFATGDLGRVHYDPDDKAIFWDEEYNVDNFVLGGVPDVLVHNTQGFHMPGEEGYSRCDKRLDRKPWPPKRNVR
jgi:hypothetical protein